MAIATMRAALALKSLGAFLERLTIALCYHERALGPLKKQALTCKKRYSSGVTNKSPAEIQSLIEDHINGFNTQNYELFLSVFAEDAIIIDGIAPYRWLNPDAPAKWLADCEKWRKDLGVTYEHLSYEMGVWAIEEPYAYASISGTLTVTMKGQTVSRTGIMAYTFSKQANQWKIGAQAWGRTS